MKGCRRLGLAAATAALAFAGGVHAADACSNVHLALATASASPGQTVSFTISNLVPGAEWAVSLEGRPVGSGVASGGDETFSFSLPDLGGEARTVTVAGTVSHEDIENSPWPVYATLGYTPPQAPAAPASAPAQAVRRSARPVVHDAPAPAVPLPAAASPPAPRAHVAPPREKAAPTHLRPRVHIVQKPRAMPRTRPVVRTRPHSVASALHALPAFGGRIVPLALPARAEPAAAPARRDRRVPVPVLLAAALLLAVAAALYLRRGRLEPSHVDEIEAELQAIIDEEHAKRERLSGVPVAPGRSARATRTRRSG